MFPDGRVFDSSVRRNDPFTFVVGQGRVIPGWDEALQHLNKGAKATVILPPELAYGQYGSRRRDTAKCHTKVRNRSIGN